jgi:hypothetical protein
MGHVREVVRSLVEARLTEVNYGPKPRKEGPLKPLGTRGYGKSKQSQIWTVRNLQGQYLGSHRAYTAKQAISNHLQGYQVTASQFKGSMHARDMTPDKMTATVEPPFDPYAWKKKKGDQ